LLLKHGEVPSGRLSFLGGEIRQGYLLELVLEKLVVSDTVVAWSLVESGALPIGAFVGAVAVLPVGSVVGWYHAARNP